MVIWRDGCKEGDMLWSFRLRSKSTPTRLLSSQELSLYDGEKGSKGVYLAILGQVFDVHDGLKHYGPGGAYHFMAGKDSSLAFVTGDFTEGGLTDDVSSLSPLQVVALFDWLAFYQKTYHTVGLATGRFYSESGEPTEVLLHIEALLTEGRLIKAESEARMRHFPACNSEWSSARGGRVWCSTKSGGVERSWTGVPRKLFSPGAGGARCVCVRDQSADEENPNLQEYEGCATHAGSCSLVEH
ncbi:neuferricin isoform X2 [Dunckerocampus dactyliophorus]|uniref:neuferricin isoform X2 n=1 Tax=Dunckerocampus dactyliophorus TaxID=161453 RepID=UPI002405BA71|nr:neuferricin isoform X2 [Dunckerocampus dactyliophorus]